MKLTVTDKTSENDVFYAITEKQARKIMAAPRKDRYDLFIKLAKEARLHDNCTDLDIEEDKDNWEEAEKDETWGDYLPKVT